MESNGLLLLSAQDSSIVLDLDVFSPGGGTRLGCVFASSLDEVEEGVDLIGAIDGEVDEGVGVEIGHGDSEADGQLVGLFGGGDSYDVMEASLTEKLADQVDGVPSGGTRAQAEDHARFNGLNRLVGGDLLWYPLKHSCF